MGYERLARGYADSFWRGHLLSCRAWTVHHPLILLTLVPPFSAPLTPAPQLHAELEKHQEARVAAEMQAADLQQNIARLKVRAGSYPTASPLSDVLVLPRTRATCLPLTPYSSFVWHNPFDLDSCSDSFSRSSAA